MKKSGWLEKKWFRNLLFVAFLVTWVFFVLVGVEYAIAYLASWILPVDVLSSPITNTLLSAISYLLTLIIAITIPPKILKSKVMENTRERLGLDGLPTWTDLGLAPIGYIATILIAAGLTALFNLFPWFNSAEAQELGYSIYMQGWERVLAFVALVVIAPIMEELLFRGWLYGKLRLEIPKVAAIIITSLLFGLVHMQWNVGISVFAMSLITCTLREITGTIYAGTLVHMINNGVAFYLVFIAGAGLLG